MSENQVSIDGRTHLLPRPFMVLATQNPVEYEGTYILPGIAVGSLHRSRGDGLSARSG
jgi:hypothetical protein